MKDFPSKKELRRVLKIAETAVPSKMLPPDADYVDHIKYDLCEKVLVYLIREKINLNELSFLLSIDKTDLSKIVNYHIERYTIDKLVRLVRKLYPDFKLGDVA